MTPDAFFGLHINSPTAAWPSLPCTTQRLWDCGTSWAELQPTEAALSFTTLESHVTRAEQQKVSLLYTLGRTPAWAASTPTAPGAYGPGQCSPPASWEIWEDFVRRIVTRYRGRIAAYELWNEPDTSAGTPTYWTGTDPELLTLCEKATAIIRAVDPAATIVSPGFVNSTGAINFINAGGGALVDVMAVHGYLFGAFEQHLPSRIQFIRDALAQHGHAEKPVWVTEWSWGKETTEPSRILQAQYLVKTMALFFGLKVERAYWYGWDTVPWGTLHDLHGDRLAGHCYREVATRLMGATPLSFTVSAGEARMRFQRESRLHAAVWEVGEQTFPSWE